MAGKGGYQPPRNPAPVSGEGSQSRRTDTQASRYIQDQPWGDAEEANRIAQANPLYKEPSAQRVPLSQDPRFKTPQATEKSARPDEPLMAGVPIGPGYSPRPRTGLVDQVAEGADLKTIATLVGMFTEADATGNASGKTRKLLRDLRTALGPLT